MIWKEKGVLKGSYMSYFNASEIFLNYYVYVVSCGYFLCNKEYEVKRTGNRHPIFFYIIDGDLHFEYEKHVYTARKNEIVLLNGSMPHHYFCTDSCEFLFFHFDGNGVSMLIDRLIKENGSPLFHLSNAKEIYSLIYEPITRLCHQERASDAFLSSIAYTALCMIPETGKDSTLFIPTRLKLTSDMISYQVIEYIDRNIRENYSVQELADHFGLSRHYFMRLFKKETGYTLQEYISIAKINYAKLMLRTTALTVSEISEYLGYASSASFINAFKLRRGISPSKYRNSDF